MKQNMKDFEVIVCDNGSNDMSLNRAMEVAANDSRFKFVSQADRGIEHALNTAFAAARGEWIAFLDDDDLYSPQRLERTWAVIIEQDPDWVACRSRKIDELGNPLLLPDGSPALSQRLNFPTACLSRLLVQRNIFGSFSNLAVRRDCLAPFLPFPSKYNRVLDYYMLLGLITRQSRVALIDEALVDRRFHQKNLSNDYAAQQVQVFPLLREFEEQIPQADSRIGCRLRTQRYLKAVQQMRRNGNLAAIKDYLSDYSEEDLDPNIYRCVQEMVKVSLQEHLPQPDGLYSKHPLAHFAEGLIQEDKLAAAKCFEKAWQAVPFVFPEALNNQAVCIASTQAQKANVLLNEALLFKPEYMDALFNACHLANGDLSLLKKTVWLMDDTWQAFIFSAREETC